LTGGKEGSVYCASKFGLRGFAQSLRLECAKSEIRVSLINPGAVRTAFFDDLHFEPGDRAENAIQPEDVAATVLSILAMRGGTVVDEINLSPRKRVWQSK
jgi:NADP-dependent 3-hydroxy acid dehydrogenase YdfG